MTTGPGGADEDTAGGQDRAAEDPVERRTDPDERPPAERESPVGAPVVRGDATVTGQRASEAVEFDPDDPDSLSRAAEVVRSFAGEAAADSVFVLRGAAAAAALVRGEGSYRAAARRAGDGVTVPFIRKWARVHDLPQSIRRQVAAGALAPSAAKHVARVGGDARFLLAWAALDADLTVSQVRGIASKISDGVPAERAIREGGVDLGRRTVEFPPAVYLELRRRASLAGVDPEEVVVEALESRLLDR